MSEPVPLPEPVAHRDAAGILWVPITGDAAVPDLREDIDWSAHRGSCRVFYAERRCTCGATVASDPMARPAEPTGDSRKCQQSDWCGPGSHCLCVPAEPTGELREQVARWLYARHHEPSEPFEEVSSGYYGDADALLSGPLRDLLAAGEVWRELLRQVVMDWVPECAVSGCACSAHRARRALGGIDHADALSARDSATGDTAEGRMRA